MSGIQEAYNAGTDNKTMIEWLSDEEKTSYEKWRKKYGDYTMDVDEWVTLESAEPG
jgi:hypothetical protein